MVQEFWRSPPRMFSNLLKNGGINYQLALAGFLNQQQYQFGNVHLPISLYPNRPGGCFVWRQGVPPGNESQILKFEPESFGQRWK